MLTGFTNHRRVWLRQAIFSDSDLKVEGVLGAAGSHGQDLVASSGLLPSLVEA